MNSTHAEYKKFLQAKYPFELISKNCTTEIFAVLNRIVDNSPEKSKEFYGGYIHTKNNLNFIPFIAFDSVGSEYLVKQTVNYESLRKKYLNELYRNKAWKKIILESNTLTSEIYETNEEDGWFLFFTDDTIFLRPIYGVFNLTTGILEAGYGILKIPFDKGKKFQTGIMNLSFSFVEIFFFNIRKGTFYNVFIPYVVRNEMIQAKE
ncbi:MAG: hypothetical protein N3A69_07170 [Leptospiraceae bacterium]|nr:hypothetical protein [Leptospiraceae bacterium]